MHKSLMLRLAADTPLIIWSRAIIRPSSIVCATTAWIGAQSNLDTRHTSIDLYAVTVKRLPNMGLPRTSIISVASLCHSF
jgi:hypothetical protein